MDTPIINAITDFDYFDSLPDTTKQAYINTVQETYHVGLREICKSMSGAPYPGRFVEYLNDRGIHGNRGAASRKTSPLWPAFLRGETTLRGMPLPLAPPSQPTRRSVELCGVPDTILQILGFALGSITAEYGSSPIRIRISVEDGSAA